MAKFCTKCGDKLEEGKECSCKTTKKTVKKVEEIEKEKIEDEVIQPKVKEASKINERNELIDNSLEVAKTVLLKPISTIKKFSKSNNVKLGLIFLALAVIAQGIFAAVYVWEIMSLFMLGSGNMLNIMMASAIDINRFDIFLYGALFSSVYYAALIFGTFLVVNKVFKVPTHYKRNTAMIGMLSFIGTVTYVLAMIGFALSFGIGLIILLLGLLYFLISFYHSIKVIDEVEDDKLGKAYLLITAISVLALYLMSMIIM